MNNKLELFETQNAHPGGQTLLWTDSDDFFSFQNMIKENPSSPWAGSEQWLTYQLNSQGYRAPEWAECQWDSSVVIMGCSNIFGVGLPFEQTVGQLVSQSIQRPVINLGFPGGTPQLTWQTIIRILNAGIRPWAWVIIWPPAHRVSEFTANPLKMINHGSWSVPQQGWPYYWVGHEYQAEGIFDYYADSARLMIPTDRVYQWSWANGLNSRILDDIMPFRGGDRARDRRHPGQICHKLMASTVLDAMKGSNDHS